MNFVTTSNPSQPTVLKNASCPYCGVALSTVAKNKEHVIGKNFVPKGKLKESWNLILNCCVTCNTAKSKLENDISAITLLADVFGKYPHEDIIAKSEALRKAERSFSSLTKKPVKESNESPSFNLRVFPSVTAKVSLVAPPQLNPNSVLQLSRLQTAAFFYWLTYKATESRGHFCPGIFQQILQSRTSDWGNPINAYFSECVSNWDLRLLANTADGFFKVAIRRKPHVDCWSWALEWNKSTRVIGFMGLEDLVSCETDSLPQIDNWKELSRTNGFTQRFREEFPLDPNVADKLFK